MSGAAWQDRSKGLREQRGFEEDTHPLPGLNSQLAPGGKDSWHWAKVEPVHKACCETHGQVKHALLSMRIISICTSSTTLSARTCVPASAQTGSTTF